MLQISLIVLMMTGSSPAVPRPALNACACVELPAPPRAEMKKAVAAELDRAVAVFVADVVRIGPNATTVTLRVRQQWKGKLGDEISMKTGVELGPDGSLSLDTCGWEYVRGKTYLVFAYGSSLADMKAIKCGLTSTADAAKTTISLLDELARGRSSP